MIARLQASAPSLAAVVSDQYLVAFGKSGGLGCFSVALELLLNRGDRVIVRTSRGIERGEVLGPATLRQARLIGALAAGDILRRTTKEDEAERFRLECLADELVAGCCARARDLNLSLQVVDAEVLVDGCRAIVQFLGDEADALKLNEAIGGVWPLDLRFENLAAPVSLEHNHDEEANGGCGKPDCGKVDGGAGGCSTCSSGGGCSSCGAGKVDLRPYFGHLRTKMEESHRIPLA